MPHIVFDQKVNIKKLMVYFVPILEKKDSIIRITDMFMNYKNWSALFFTQIIASNKQEFFIELSTRDSKTTIRLFPLTDPQKTDEVKRSLVLVYEFIQKHYEEIIITQTNLKQYLKN